MMNKTQKPINNALGKDVPVEIELSKPRVSLAFLAAPTLYLAFLIHFVLTQGGFNSLLEFRYLFFNPIATSVILAGFSHLVFVRPPIYLRSFPYYITANDGVLHFLDESFNLADCEASVHYPRAGNYLILNISERKIKVAPIITKSNKREIFEQLQALPDKYE